MKRSSLCVSVLVWIGLVLVACSSAASRCRSQCEKKNKCPGAAQTDCAPVCEDVVSKVDKAGCSSEYNTAITCLDKVSDVCDVHATACTDESKAYSDCYNKFCTTNPSDPICKG